MGLQGASCASPVQIAGATVYLRIGAVPRGPKGERSRSGACRGRPLVKRSARAERALSGRCLAPLSHPCLPPRAERSSASACASWTSATACSRPSRPTSSGPLPRVSRVFRRRKALPRSRPSRSPPFPWYLTGFLAPSGGRAPDVDDLDSLSGEAVAGSQSTADDAGSEEPEAKQRSFFPASMGLSVFLPPALPGSTTAADFLEVVVSYAYYDDVEIADDKEHKKSTAWKRVPVEPITVRVPLDPEALKKGVPVRRNSLVLRGELRTTSSVGSRRTRGSCRSSSCRGRSRRCRRRTRAGAMLDREAIEQTRATRRAASGALPTAA